MSNAEVIGLLREISAPRIDGEKINEVIARVAAFVGFSVTRTSDIWYDKARRVTDDELAAIDAALIRKRREAARNELSELRLRLERLESLLAISDPDFVRSAGPQVGEQVRRMGGRPGALARSNNQGSAQ